MRPARAPIEDLRLAIDRLPLRTREALLAGIGSHEVMLGSRTSFPAFARAWDRFAGGRWARRATGRELRVLERHLLASILADCGGDLGEAIAEHQALARDRKADEAGGLGLEWLREREPV
jgi:hypothetical protein